MQASQRLSAQTNADHLPSADQNKGVTPSDWQDCYRLRGLAQQMCLTYYK